MSKTKAGGKTRQKPPRAGKRLGVKTGQGKTVKPGNILIRQRGSKIHPGQGVSMGRDFTIFATTIGTVNFHQKHGKKIIEVIAQ
ncbi:50S ribosomal protein L27 [Candidatus Shapirobacteria bacterium CG09_land_8_20_14_0_10_38_17]|uniref:Large ribosomal subunit protein bL27 n=1 Tax=Candidatus Shapirobacteria bacterium CG09_land_8_20_14_0_10_38_17 TaxID=1974884 RepID=A0A2H0WRT6_9BACT|nr:MAG: 50S ribosomal protein L27 [Candidatus Shapirobacteria bacterium CG09_land_8_20_14_0_10_38_17]